MDEPTRSCLASTGTEARAGEAIPCQRPHSSKRETFSSPLAQITTRLIGTFAAELDRFNRALEYFDPLTQGNQRPRPVARGGGRRRDAPDFAAVSTPLDSEAAGVTPFIAVCGSEVLSTTNARPRRLFRSDRSGHRVELSDCIVLMRTGGAAPGFTTQQLSRPRRWHVRNPQMKAAQISVVVLAMVYAAGLNSASADQVGNSDAAVINRYVSFDDIAPAGLTLEACWNAMGMDTQERVYIGFTSRRSDGREDFAVFRYDPATADRLFLGTFIDASQAVGNLRPQEEIPKGHTRMLEIGEKMYMGSQGFHDLKGPIDTLPNYRGAHLYAYDLRSGKLEDVSASLPDGVVTQHQGVIALSVMPGYDLLVALAHPSSDIVLFDYRHNKVREIVPGIPWRLGNPLSREVIATKKGQIYTYRGTEDPADRGEVHKIWAFDLNTHAMKPTAYTATGGFWNGQTWTRDGQTVYASTVNGELYKLDVEEEVFTHLGHFLPKDEYDAGVRVTSLYGITLSADEKRIYGIPRTTAAGRSNLYSYEIATGDITMADKLKTAIYTGSNMHDSRGNIYFAGFGDDETGSAKVRLAMLHPSTD